MCCSCFLRLLHARTSGRKVELQCLLQYCRHRMCCASLMSCPCLVVWLPALSSLTSSFVHSSTSFMPYTISSRPLPVFSISSRSIPPAMLACHPYVGLIALAASDKVRFFNQQANKWDEMVLEHPKQKDVTTIAVSAVKKTDGCASFPQGCNSKGPIAFSWLPLLVFFGTSVAIPFHFLTMHVASPYFSPR